MSKLSVTETDRLIGKRIQQRRKELGFSASALSEKIDIVQQQLSRYERGENKINVAHLVDIATVLNTEISWFFWKHFCKKFNKKELLIRYSTDLTFRSIFSFIKPMNDRGQKFKHFLDRGKRH